MPFHVFFEKRKKIPRLQIKYQDLSCKFITVLAATFASQEDFNR